MKLNEIKMSEMGWRIIWLCEVDFFISGKIMMMKLIFARVEQKKEIWKYEKCQKLFKNVDHYEDDK